MQSLKLFVVRLILGFRSVVIDIFTALLFAECKSPKRILIHRIGTFGDSIVALPALSSIKNSFPDAKIDFVTTHATTINLSTIIEEGFFDSVYLFDKKSARKELVKLRNGKYDLVIDIPQKYGLYKSIRNMLVVRFYLRVKSAFGWDSGFTKLFAREQMEFMPPKREVVRFLDTLRRNGIEPEEEYPLKLRSSAELADFAITHPTEKNIAFCIGTNVAANEWSIDNWVGLAIELVGRGYKIILIGGEQERQKASQIKAISSDIFDFCGDISISQSAFLLQNCTLAISHDTGAMHLSYAVGTRVVVLFSTRQFFTKWAPPENLGVVLSSMQECSGCFKSKCRDNVCMKKVTVDDVLAVSSV